MKKWILALAAAALLAGCSDKPSEGDLEDMLTAKLNDGYELFEIDDFEKLDALTKGEDTYLVDVQYTLVFTKDLKEVAEDLRKESKGSGLGDLGAGLGLMALKMQFGDFKDGDEVEQKQTLVLRRSEEGWKLVATR
ncbi:lipoprotein [Gallaecimonas xiamenensis]|uniref:Type IV secretion system putative lipoprotein virB7 n=1 Tax=Gallaecimonas xiamenensis 3-C-1 TaxID=745411 RepID=K2IYV7_9GAMM|nr:lipoprotein [Gallaecimonas xiamenensis]EKE75651.1 hypothetical protein B3C1_06213 [Gallaecimonas xiamenensis 3-C-1]